MGAEACTDKHMAMGTSFSQLEKGERRGDHLPFFLLASFLKDALVGKLTSPQAKRRGENHQVL